MNINDFYNDVDNILKTIEYEKNVAFTSDETILISDKLSAILGMLTVIGAAIIEKESSWQSRI